MLEKVCSMCPPGTGPKPLTAFRRNTRKKDGLQTLCRACEDEIKRDYYRRNTDKVKAAALRRTKSLRLTNRRMYWEYLATHPCVDCGEADPVVLEHDHFDEADKVDSISNMISWGDTWARIAAELLKGEIRCANCHKRRTARQFSWTKAGVL